MRSNKILKGQYFHYTVGSYSYKDYHLVEALKDISNEQFRNKAKIIKSVLISLDNDCICDKTKTNLYNECDACEARQSNLLPLVVFELMGCVEVMPTYGEVNYETCGDINETIYPSILKNDVRLTDKYEDIKKIIKKHLNEQRG